MGVLQQSLFSATLRPVSQKLRLSFVRQRVIEELIDHFERHRRNVCAHPSRLDHMNRVPQTRSENFSLPRIVLVNLNDVLQQQQSVLADVVETAQKRADES